MSSQAPEPSLCGTAKTGWERVWKASEWKHLPITGPRLYFQHQAYSVSPTESSTKCRFYR